MEILALALISGGLDSILAAKVMADHPGVKVVGYHFRHLFEPDIRADGLSPAEHAAFAVGISIIEDWDDRAFLDMIISPELGRGKGANPCRDCRAFILKRAERMMNMVGGKILVTGEVVGQRPMSQMKNYLNQIENKANLRGKILRPLSGKILPPTEAEERGWIDRDRLFDFSGRSRKPQMALAEEFGIGDYPNPAGGCLLTQKAYAEKFFDILEHDGEVRPSEIHLIKTGRYYRLPGGLRMIIPRDASDNNALMEIAHGKSLLVYADGIPGPTAALNREPSPEELNRAGALVATYGKGSSSKTVRMVIEEPSGERRYFDVKPANKEDFREYLIL